MDYLLLLYFNMFIYEITKIKQETLKYKYVKYQIV